MKKRKLNPIIIVLLCAFCAVIIMFLVLYLMGYRYINDEGLGIKFIGMTESGVPKDGKLYYSNGAKGTLDSKTSSLILNNGEQYTGELKGFLPHGEGVFKTADGNVYDGTFLNGECTGKAHVTYNTNDVYDGDMVKGKREGRGTYTSESGSVYTGGFTNNNKNGKGYSVSADGSVYIGEYKNSIKDGFGAFLFENGDIYVGEFVNDKRTGKGIYVWAKSEEYSSEFDEMFNIEFTEEFEEKFFKYFENEFFLHFAASDSIAEEYDLPFWQSLEKILSRSQVECYIGEFNENIIEGQGKYTWLSGIVVDGEFENGDIKKNTEE